MLITTRLRRPSAPANTRNRTRPGGRSPSLSARAGRIAPASATSAHTASAQWRSDRTVFDATTINLASRTPRGLHRLHARVADDAHHPGSQLLGRYRFFKLWRADLLQPLAGLRGEHPPRQKYEAL